jgi:GTPase SAR1 family protein
MTVAETLEHSRHGDTGATRAYGDFRLQRERLGELLARVERALADLGLESRARQLGELRSKVESTRFKVMILGEFKRGKSTVINALLGQRVLPVKAVPCTATINEIGWGEEKRAVVHFRTPLPEKLPDGLPSEVREHLDRHPEAPPPLEVAAEELPRFVTIPDPAREQADSVARTPYERVQLFWPLELCRNGVEIIDSPGLNEHGTRNRIVREYLEAVDGVVFVLSSDQLASASELEVVDRTLRAKGHEDILFVCNAFDRIHPSDREEVREVGIGKLASRTKLGASGVFFLSALEALEARLQASPDREEASGMPVFEDRLAHFLTHERGRVKLLQPARQLRATTTELRRDVLPGQRRLLEEELSGIEARRRAIEPRLAIARENRDRAVKGVETSLDLLQYEVQSATEDFLDELPEGFSKWIDGLEVETKIKLATIHQKEQLERLVAELSKQAESWFQEHADQWEETTIRPMVRKRLESAVRGAESSLELFGDALDGSRAMAGIGGADTSSTASRMGFVVEGLAMGMALQPMVLGIGAMLLGFTALWVLVPLGLAACALGFWQAEDSYVETVKGKFKRKVLEHLGAARERLLECSVEGVQHEGRQLLDRLHRALSEELAAVQEELDAVGRDKRAGEKRIRARRALLDHLESELGEVDASLDDLLFVLAETT